jgi:hypothetical protein
MMDAPRAILGAALALLAATVWVGPRGKARHDVRST